VYHHHKGFKLMLSCLSYRIFLLIHSHDFLFRNGDDERRMCPANTWNKFFKAHKKWFKGGHHHQKWDFSFIQFIFVRSFCVHSHSLTIFCSFIILEAFVSTFLCIWNRKEREKSLSFKHCKSCFCSSHVFSLVSHISYFPCSFFCSTFHTSYNLSGGERNEEKRLTNAMWGNTWRWKCNKPEKELEN